MCRYALFSHMHMLMHTCKTMSSSQLPPKQKYIIAMSLLVNYVATLARRIIERRPKFM